MMKSGIVSIVALAMTALFFSAAQADEDISHPGVYFADRSLVAKKAGDCEANPSKLMVALEKQALNEARIECMEAGYETCTQLGHAERWKNYTYGGELVCNTEVHVRGR